MFCRARFLWAPSRWCTARLPRHLCAICASLLPLLGRAGRPCAAWNIPPKKGARVAAAKEEMASQVSASTSAKGNANVGCPFRWCFRRTINNVAAICYYCCVFPSRPITPFRPRVSSNDADASCRTACIAHAELRCWAFLCVRFISVPSAWSSQTSLQQREPSTSCAEIFVAYLRR